MAHKEQKQTTCHLSQKLLFSTKMVLLAVLHSLFSKWKLKFSQVFTSLSTALKIRIAEILVFSLNLMDVMLINYIGAK